MLGRMRDLSLAEGLCFDCHFSLPVCLALLCYGLLSRLELAINLCGISMNVLRRCSPIQGVCVATDRDEAFRTKGHRCMWRLQLYRAYHNVPLSVSILTLTAK